MMWKLLAFVGAGMVFGLSRWPLSVCACWVINILQWGEAGFFLPSLPLSWSAISFRHQREMRVKTKLLRPLHRRRWQWACARSRRRGKVEDFIELFSFCVVLSVKWWLQCSTIHPAKMWALRRQSLVAIILGLTVVVTTSSPWTLRFGLKEHISEQEENPEKWKLPFVTRRVGEIVIRLSFIFSVQCALFSRWKNPSA